MTRPEEKLFERRCLSFLLRRFPDLIEQEFAIENGNDHGEPDLFVRRAGGITLGIEVTRLRHPNVGRFSKSAIDSARSDICRRAKQIYQESCRPRVRMNAYITDGPYRNCEEVARYIANLVSERVANDEVVSVDLWPSQGAPVEIHLTAWVCDENDLGEWTINSVGETLILTCENVQKVISRKGGKLQGYRKSCDAVWLLIMSLAFPAWSDYSVPVEAHEWQLEHEFDGVLVYCQSTDRLLRY